MIAHMASAALAGFSIVAACILLIAYLFYLPEMRKTAVGKAAAALVLACLAALQAAHFHHFLAGTDLLATRGYALLLLLVPAAFFFFSRETLFQNIHYSWWHLAHFLPLALGVFLPLTVIPPVAFVIGTIYTFWFARRIFELRKQRARFKFEMFFFGMFALMALLALLLGLALPVLNVQIFFLAYSNFIAIAMVLVVSALLIFPHLLSDITDITELAYAKTKLGGVDIRRKRKELEQLMNEDCLYQNEELSLGSVADALNLSVHQLSELINTEFDTSFPKYVREHRIAAAKSQLLAEPNTSILAISMANGFRSQSNFYAAFKESTGHSPGQFRQLQKK